MKLILFCCFFTFLINNSFSLIGGNNTYNPNLSSVVYIRYEIEEYFIIECAGIVFSSTFVLTSSECLEPFIRIKAQFEEKNRLRKRNKIEWKGNFFLFVNFPNKPHKFTIASLNKFAKNRIFMKSFIISSEIEDSYIKDYLHSRRLAQSHLKMSIFKILPSINMKEMNITQINNRTSHDYPKTLIIVGYDNYGYLSWAKMPTIPCPTEKNVAFNNSVCVDEQNSTVTTNSRDIGGPAFNEKYELVGVYCGKIGLLNYYSVPLDSEMKEFEKKQSFREKVFEFIFL